MYDTTDNNNNNNQQRQQPPPSPSSQVCRPCNERTEQLRIQCELFLENHHDEQEALLQRDSKIWIMPFLVGSTAFTFFPQTIQTFHNVVEFLSFGQYTGELSDDIRPVINGPVTLTISILFGSLVSMTISTLYERQTEIHKVGIATVNEARYIQFLAEGLNEPQRSIIKDQVKVFTLQRLQTFFRGDMFAKENRNNDINPLLLTLHEVSQYDNGPYVSELYVSLRNLKQIWIDYVAAVQKSFTPAHYINLGLQATTLLIILLWETDDTALLEAHPFELRVAWTLLLSTLASLWAIIGDLNTPVSNIITMIRKHQVDMDEMIYFGLAQDLDVVEPSNLVNGISDMMNITGINTEEQPTMTNGAGKK